MVWSTFFVVLCAALTNTQIVSTETRFTRAKTNFFDPVLSANVYAGHVKENERIVQLEPRLYASDPDPQNTLNGKICGYELSVHKHDDIIDDITQNIPFTVEILDNNQPVIKLKSSIEKLDCEIKQIHRLFIRAYDCAANEKRRYSERSSLIITVDDVNEHAPVFTHNNYQFKLHQDEVCDASTCRVEATDDDCGNQNHEVCGYEITTPNVPFLIDTKGVITMIKPLNKDQYDFDVIAVDCFPADDKSRKVSQPARVTVKIIRSCKPMITDKSPSKIVAQSDNMHLFETINVNTCDETCNVEDIVGTVELDTKGLDSGCDPQQCSTIDREYVLLAKDGNSNTVPQTKIMSFNGYQQAFIVNQSDFSGHFNNEFTIRMWMKHTHDDKNNHNNDKEHIFCKSDKTLKNRHHTALFIQSNYIKLLIRKGPLSTNEKTTYTSEWMWKVPQLNDNQWHSYKFIVNYPTKIILNIDGQVIVPTNDNYREIPDYPLGVIPGIEDTVFALGACWHARAHRLAQQFHGQLSGLVIDQKEELQRSSHCVRDCHQYIDLPDVQSGAGAEFGGNVNRSMWILRADSTESYENLLKHVVYRNTFQPMGPSGQRTVSIRTRVKCLGERTAYDLPTFTRDISIERAELPLKIELRADTNFLAPEKIMNRGIYLFLNLSIYTNSIKKKNQGDISDCTISAVPSLSKSEQLIIPNVDSLDTEVTKEGALITGIQSIDTYQSLLRQIAFISRSPVTYVDRSFTLSCAGAYDQAFTNDLRVRVRIEKQMAPPPPVAAVGSNKLVVNNDEIRDNLYDFDGDQAPVKRNVSDWPIAVVVCISVGIAGVLVLYLIVRIRSSNRQHNPTTNNGDDIHSQMEWEDDIGLNITINPLDETKKSVQSVNIHNVEKTMNEYPGSSSDDDGEEYENDGHNKNEYSSEEDDYEHDKIHPKKVDHQLEWDDAAIEYGPKKV